MKSYDEMYQSVLSRYDEYQRKKKKRIRTIRRTVPVLVCFCFAVVFGLINWNDLEKLPKAPVSPDMIEEYPTDTSEETTSPERTSATESSSAGQDIQTTPSATAIPPALTESVTKIAAGTVHSITAAVSADNSETDAPVTTTPVSGSATSPPPQTTASAKPANNLQSTAPAQTTGVPPTSTETATQPVNDDSRVLYPIGAQISIERYRAMAAASYLIYNDIETPGTATTQTAATVPQETATTTTAAPDDTQAALEKLTQKENRLFGEFQRERAVILGELSPDAPRLSLDKALEIIESSDSFAEICRKMHESQPLVDYIGGSGITRVEYWFDDKGSQKIYLIMEEESIFYFNFKGADIIYS